MTARTGSQLLERLPQVRGRISADAPLKGVTWFRVGGPAAVMFRPADQADLQDFLAATPGDIEITTMGVASNLLVRDGGVEGVVIRLGRAFNEITLEGNEVTAGAAVLDLNLAKAAQQAGLTGLEFFCGIPGTIGGAVRMNAGAYHCETKDVLKEALFIDRGGKLHRLQRDEIGFAYRHSDIPADWICVSATFTGEPGEKEQIARRMTEIQSQRSLTQPIRARTGGSTFKNPEGHKAWKLIDEAGCRGLAIGDAMVSEKHCNFLINLGEATATDLERLGEEVRKRVREKSGILLEWEIKRIGFHGSQYEENAQ